MIQQTLDLALGRAFVPDPQDTLIPLAKRFAKKPLIAVTVFKDGYEFVPVTFAGGQPAFGAAQAAAPAGEDADADALRAFAEKHKAKDCLINLATGYTAVLSSRTRRPESDEEAILLMRDSPERLLGEAPAHGCRPSIVYHPTHNFAVVFHHKENEIGSAVVMAQKAGLALARLQCGMSSLLGYVLGHHWSEIGRECELLFVDRSSVFTMAVAEGSFSRPLFDVGLKETALKQAIVERVAKLKRGGRKILVNTSGIDVAAMIREEDPAAEVAAPLQGQDQPLLRACCSDRPRLGYDLFPGERTVRPHASPQLRPVPLLFWGVAAAFLVAFSVNAVRTAGFRRDTATLRSQAQTLEQGKKQAEGTMQEVAARTKVASDIADWLLISPMTQALLIQINQEIQAATEEGIKESKPVAEVGSLSLIRQEGQPQMRLSIVLNGDSSAANRVFQRISALFGRLGYSTVDLRETSAPQGFRYEHLVNLPKGGVL
ncbi:MAG TPA: hypothetical protein VHC86_07560 [Opitutaceae bacterium]|nr:hypothetical protein [Opitutaceae bacterium]